MEKKSQKAKKAKKANRASVSRDRIYALLDEVVGFYDDHHMTETTFNFFVKKGKEFLEGRLTFKEWQNLDVPEPRGDEPLGFSW